MEFAQALEAIGFIAPEPNLIELLKHKIEL